MGKLEESLQEGYGSKCGLQDEPSEWCMHLSLLGSRGVWNCWQVMCQFWLEHLELGLWVVVGALHGLRCQSVLAQVPWDIAADTEVYMHWFNLVFHGHT